MFDDRLQYLRKEKNISMRQMAKELKLPYTTYVNYEKSQREPNSEILIKIAEYFDVSIDYLLGLQEKTFMHTPSIDMAVAVKNHLSLNTHETKVIATYRKLDAHGRGITACVMDFELKRIEDEKKDMERALQAATNSTIGTAKAIPCISNYDDYTEPPKTYQFTFFDEMPASAGLGTYAIDIAYAETIDLTSPPPRGATYMIRVTGDSMAPTINDNDKVFVKSQPAIEIGEIGIFIVNNEVYIKELGRGRLISHNEAYDDIVFCEYDEIICKGKFLGVYEQKK